LHRVRRPRFCFPTRRSSDLHCTASSDTASYGCGFVFLWSARLIRIGWKGDSLWAFDRRLPRVTLLDPNREVARTVVGSSLLRPRSEEHTSELQSRENLVCRH